MEQSPPLVFSGITAEQFSRLSAKARAAGIALKGNIGSASKFGVEVSWDYSPAAQQLTLQCLSTPFFVKPAEVNAKIQKLVKESMD
jgi:hypothetical protein